MFGIAATRSGRFERRTARRVSTWTRDYLRGVALADLGCAVLGVFVAAQIRFGNNVTSTYLALSLALPVLWIAAMRRRPRRKRLSGTCSRSVAAVRHEPAMADLVNEPGRDRYPGLTVVGACVARPGESEEVSGVPVYSGLDDITTALQASSADTVAVTTGPEVDGISLRRLARICPRSSRCGSTCGTSRTGRSRSTCRSCGRRSRCCFAGRGPINGAFDARCAADASRHR